ncbi:MAG: polysaccharide deacetylase family protein [Oscillospiraceae bacterium]|nr:polysaccharide deacetylase family protein [Oscillospiraceae bacterium]
MPTYALMRKIGEAAERARGAGRGLVLTPSRRIARVAPPGERVVAMTFEDGPTKLPAPPGGAGLTEQLLSVLKEFGARGTFAVVGSTAENYPDTPGKPGSRYALGKKYDHYAAFGLDDMAGALACPELIRKIDREGHELANHTYRHIMYGKSRAYAARAALGGLNDAARDLKRLHDLIYSLTKYEMRFARPPHGIDKMADGHTSFDAFEAMGYHYLASGLSTGERPPRRGYEESAEAMARPLRDALEAEPTSLAGRIISQKDVCDTTGRSPAVSALRLRLELLERYGYRVITASELVERSPFEDVRPAHDCFEAARELDRAGFTIGFRNNRFYPERTMTKSELGAVFTLPGKPRPSAVTVDKNDAATPRMISARADEVFEKTKGQPRSAGRGDAAVWLYELAVLNGLC